MFSCTTLFVLPLVLGIVYVAYRYMRYQQIKKRVIDSPDNAFHDLHVIITGASSGIGEELAYRYARGGAKIVITARRESELRRVQNTCLTKYGNNQVNICVADMGKEDDCKRMVEECLKLLDGRVDILLLNAGLGSLQRFSHAKDLEAHRKLMEVNYWGCVNTTFYMLPHLKTQVNGAKIVVISSVLGKTGTVFRTAYASSKHALHGFYSSLRLEFINEKVPIQISLICPGFVKTNIHINAIGSTKDNLKRDLSRFMSVEECADKVLIAIEEGDFEVFLDSLGILAAYVSPFLPYFISDKMKINAALRAANTDKQE